MTVKQATDVVIHKFEDKAIQSVRSHDIQHNEQADRRYTELKDMIHRQNELILQLTDKLDKQQEYINDRLEKRDRALMGVINDMQETKRQIASTEGKKLGFFK